MEHKHRHWVGMRLAKTMIAVFISGCIGSLRHQNPFYSMIASVVCLQNSTEKTLTSSANRAIGTLVGGLYGVVILYALIYLKADHIEVLRYFVVSLAIIPLIRTVLMLKRPSSASLSCVVFLSITINHNTDSSPALFALHRMVDTLVGIGVTCIIDSLLPYRSDPKTSNAELVSATTNSHQQESNP